MALRAATKDVRVTGMHTVCTAPRSSSSASHLSRLSCSSSSTTSPTDAKDVGGSPPGESRREASTIFCGQDAPSLLMAVMLTVQIKQVGRERSNFSSRHD